MPRRPKQPPPLPKRRHRNTGSVGTRASDGRCFAILPRDLDPKRRPIYAANKGQPFTSEADAAHWLDGEVAKRRDPPPRAASLSEPLGAYLARWYALYSPGWPPRTASVYGTRVRHCAPIANVALGDVTHEVVQSLIAQLQRATWQRHTKDGTPVGQPKPYSPRTIAQIRTTLHQALDELVPHVLAFNPVKRSRVGRFQEAEQPVWDAEQADRFLTVAETRYAHLALAFRLILRRALRRGEVLSLTWPDVDWKRRLLIVDETAGERVGQTGATKGRRRREIPLSADLLQRLRERRDQQATLTRWVFANGQQPYSIATLNRAAEVISQAARLPHIGPKDMRATAATILLDEGVALVRVSRLLGHASTATTSRFYERALRTRQERVEMLSAEIDSAFDRASAANDVDDETDLSG